MHPQCLCGKGKKTQYPSWENLDNTGVPGSHKKIYECDNCFGNFQETVERHAFKKELNWYCSCGAQDPVHPELYR